MPKMMIYGGCVSRDTKGIFPSDWTMETYIARQSVISAACGPVRLPGESNLTSQFQQRMVDGDIAGNALDTVASQLRNNDLFIFDLIIDRRGIFEVRPEEFVSRSDEMINSRLLKQQETEARWIDFGTEEHFHLWKKSVLQLLRIITASNTPTAFIAPKWAEVDSEGKELLYQTRPVAEWNATYARYNQVISDYGIPTIGISPELAVGDINHQWGLTPFHFVRPAYECIRSQLIEYYESTLP